MGSIHAGSLVLSSPIISFPTHFEKAASAELERLLRLLSRQERSVRSAFLAFVFDSRSTTTMRQIRSLLEAGRSDDALAILDTHINRIANELAKGFTTAGEAQVQSLISSGVFRSNVGIGFDPTHPRAVTLMQQNRMQFVQRLSRLQREATRRALMEALRLGLGARDVASYFRDSIGLTPGQWDAVNNYRQLLETGSREALDRDLRDRRFDRTVQRGDLSGAQIDRMVTRYRDRSLQWRAETIARTEMLRVLNQANQEGLQQVVEQVGIDRARVERVWRATKDHRTRDTHWAMDRQVRGIDEPFLSPSGALLMHPGDPRAPASETVNCRCVIVNRIARSTV